MRAGVWEGRHFHIGRRGVWVRGGGGCRVELRGAGGHPIRAGLGFRDVATAGPADRVGEGEGADPAVQGSHLTAGA